MATTQPVTVKLPPARQAVRRGYILGAVCVALAVITLVASSFAARLTSAPVTNFVFDATEITAYMGIVASSVGMVLAVYTLWKLRELDELLKNKQ